MTAQARFPLLVLSESPHRASRLLHRFTSQVRQSGGSVLPRGMLVREVMNQVREVAPATHVLFLGARDTPVTDFVKNIDHVVFDEFTQDVLYADKTVSTKSPEFGDERRLPAWSPHRIEHENFVGESFLVRIAFLLSMSAHLEPDDEWDSWAFLRAANECSARILKVDETWFSTTRLPSPFGVKPHRVMPPTFAPSDCTLITLTAGASDESRNFSTLVEEHLDAIAHSNASDAEHILVVGPECPELLRGMIMAKSSSTFKVVEVADRFNFSHRCNIARTVSSGAITVLVNDDFVPSRPDWLERLIEPFSDPLVGITGATMLYADDTVQHIGVGVRNGNFQHFYAGAELSEPRVSQLIQMNREVDAVTGACFAIRTELFDAAGGLTEGFPLNYNDVDLCLKVRALGYSVILVGAPLGYHLESRTRPAVSLPEESLLFFSRWPFRSIESDYPFENWA